MPTSTETTPFQDEDQDDPSKPQDLETTGTGKGPTPCPDGATWLRDHHVVDMFHVLESNQIFCIELEAEGMHSVSAGIINRSSCQGAEVKIWVTTPLGQVNEAVVAQTSNSLFSEDWGPCQRMEEGTLSPYCTDWEGKKFKLTNGTYVVEVGPTPILERRPHCDRLRIAISAHPFSSRGN